MGFYTATEVPYNDVIYRLVCIFIYIYVLLYVLQIQYVREYIHTIQARERARETLPTINPLQTVLIEMRRFQS